MMWVVHAPIGVPCASDEAIRARWAPHTIKPRRDVFAALTYLQTRFPQLLLAMGVPDERIMLRNQHSR